MMKRIAIFCDGTWNTPDKMEDGKYCQTNVVKMANALATTSIDGTIQMLYYDSGIGSEGGFLKRVFDGATGSGISENILQAYRFIIKNYDPGDELFLFGFSRGAFTVRSLTGLIRNSGVLKIEHLDKVARAYSIYRSRRQEHQPREVEATLFRKTFAVEESTKIKFIGVWDTVGALGNPLFLKGILSRKNQFHNTNLSSRIENAFHALAINEKRKNFKVALWYQEHDTREQILDQVWFAGVHSDIGGGYPEDETSLSDISLKWMLKKVQSCKLTFNPITMNSNPMGSMHESRKGFYKFKKSHFRPMDKIDSQKGITNESIHPTVIERYNSDPYYRPGNLIDYFKQHPM